MNEGVYLRVIAGISVVFALALAVLTMATGFAPAAPAYLTFLFIGLVGSFASRSVRDLEKRVRTLERREP